jgi:hypothetical protein
MPERHIARFKPRHFFDLLGDEPSDPTEIVVAEAVLAPPLVHFLHAPGFGAF